VHLGAVEHGGRLRHAIEQQRVTGIYIPRSGQAMPSAAFNQQRTNQAQDLARHITRRSRR
jgi:hypothetical protein